MMSEVLQSLLKPMVGKFTNHQFECFLSRYRAEYTNLLVDQRHVLFEDTLRLFLDLADEACKAEDENKNRPVVFCLHAHCDTDTPHEELIRGATFNTAELFSRLCLYCATRQQDLEHALRSAAHHQQSLFVIWFCIAAAEVENLSEIVVNGLWSPDHCYVHLLPQCLGWDMCDSRHIALQYLRKTLAAKDDWTGLSGLRTWGLSVLTLFLQMRAELDLTPQERAAVPAFVEKCEAEGAFGVAVFMSALLRDWPSLIRVVRGLPVNFREDNCTCLLQFIKTRVPLDVLLEVIVALLEDSFTNVLRFDSWRLHMTEVSQMASLCRATGRNKWLALFDIQLDEWDWAEMYASSTTDTETVDLVLVHAALCSRWDTVLLLLPRCSKDKDVHMLVFKQAVNVCCAKVVQQLLPYVDLSEIPFEVVMNRTPLALPYVQTYGFTRRFALSNNQRADFEKIIQLLVQGGISTRCRDGMRALRSAILWRMPSVARLLLASGVVTRFEYRQTLDEDTIKEFLDKVPELKKELEDVIPQVLPDGVRSLRDLARLAVSHSLGCHAGRRDRVQALPLPAPLKRLVTFGDLCPDSDPQ